MNNKTLTLQEAAVFLKMTPEGLRIKANNGEIPGAKPGKRWVFMENDLAEYFRWHDLRHTWASWHVQSGTSLQELQMLGGWASFEMVLRYAYLSSEHLKNAADRISIGQPVINASL